MYASIQVILESLPISSSGHLKLLGAELSRGCEYLMHGPTIIVLSAYLAPRGLCIIRHLTRTLPLIYHMFWWGFIAECITVVCYVLAQLVSPIFPLWLGFLLTGAALFSTKYAPSGGACLSWRHAACIGAVQGFAGIPGISRLASTYSAGVWLGIPARVSFLFSCMIQLPLMIGGFAYALLDMDGVMCFSIIPLTLATIIAYILLVIVGNLAQRKALWPLGLYMIIPALIAFVR